MDSKGVKFNRKIELGTGTDFFVNRTYYAPECPLDQNEGKDTPAIYCTYMHRAYVPPTCIVTRHWPIPVRQIDHAEKNSQLLSSPLVQRKTIYRFPSQIQSDRGPKCGRLLETLAIYVTFTLPTRPDLTCGFTYALRPPSWAWFAARPRLIPSFSICFPSTLQRALLAHSRRFIPAGNPTFERIDDALLALCRGKKSWLRQIQYS